MYRESVNFAKQKENESNEKLNMFNLEIYARVVFYGLRIGFIYNYVYFNILDVIESNELLSVVSLIALGRTILYFKYSYFITILLLLKM